MALVTLTCKYIENKIIHILGNSFPHLENPEPSIKVLSSESKLWVHKEDPGHKLHKNKQQPNSHAKTSLGTKKDTFVQWKSHGNFASHKPGMHCYSSVALGEVGWDSTSFTVLPWAWVAASLLHVEGFLCKYSTNIRIATSQSCGKTGSCIFWHGFPPLTGFSCPVIFTVSSKAMAVDKGTDDHKPLPLV